MQTPLPHPYPPIPSQNLNGSHKRIGNIVYNQDQPFRDENFIENALTNRKLTTINVPDLSPVINFTENTAAATTEQGASYG